jgi:hypothetical protein
MRAHEIIVEATQQSLQLRSRAMTWKDLAQALPRIQLAIQQANKGNRIYRGLGHNDEPVLFKPQMPPGTRASAHTDNTYTLFIDNNQKWSNYPPRSASIIASNDLSVAEGFGNTYLVLPEGNPAIGVASRADFWISFPRLRELDAGDYWKLPDLNGAISYTIRKWFHRSLWRPRSWPELKKDLASIDKINHFSFPIPVQKPLDLVWAKKLLSFHPGTTMEQKLEYLLDPQANGFELTSLSEFTSDDQEKEIWLSAPCWFINTAELPDNWLTGGLDLKSWIQQKAAE